MHHYVEEAERNRTESVRRKKESEALLEKQALRQKEEALRKKKALTNGGK